MSYIAVFDFRPSEEPQGWMEYFGQALKSSATYLPTQVSDMFNQGRDFAVARLPCSGMKNVCTITRCGLLGFLSQ